MADILVVEDKESLRTMLRKTLEVARLQPSTRRATPSRPAASSPAFRYLVVLTDLKLPAGSGFDVLQAALEADAETPVVVMTAFGTVEEAVRAMKEGASGLPDQARGHRPPAASARPRHRDRAAWRPSSCC